MDSSENQKSSSGGNQTVNPDEHLLDPRRLIPPADINRYREEAIALNNYFKDFEKDFLDSAIDSFYVISNKWLSLWKLNVSFNELANDKDPDLKYLGQIDLPTLNEDIVVEIPRLLKYSDRDHYCNVSVKPYLQYEIDYFILNENAWRFISERYPSAIAIKRPAFLQADGHRKVEVYLKQIQLVPINNTLLRSIDHAKITELKHYVIQVSSQRLLEDFRRDLSDLASSHEGRHLFEAGTYAASQTYSEDNVRLWKLDSQATLADAFSQFKEETNKSRSYEYRIPFKGDYVFRDLKKKVEDSTIADSDFVFFEVRDNGKGWNLTGDGVPNIDKCDYCSKYEQLPYPCACKKVAYCSEECRYKDKKFHQGRCDKAGEEEEEAERNLLRSSGSRLGLTGLQNLGNTCFMNGGLQCMLNLKELTEYFLENKFLKEINEINPLGTKGKLVKKYASLVKNVWYGTQSVYSPWALKSALSQFAPMFSGYQQHDSQEFLAYLIDGIHEDLNRVKKKPIVEQIETENHDDYEVAMMSWENHLKRNQSVIVDLLHGQYKSTIVCPDCKRISITFDPFNCVSLPIPDKKFKEIDFFYIYANNKTRAVKMNVKFPKLNHTIKDLKEEVGRLLERDPKKFYFIFSGHTNKEVVKDETVATNAIRKKKKLKNLFAFEIPDEDFKPEDPDQIHVDMQITKKGSDYFGNVQRKNHTFIRSVVLNKNNTLRQVYVQAFKYFRFLFDEAWPESDRERWLAKNDEEAFKEVYDAQEEKPFKLYNVTNTRGFQECFFCSERRCENCPLACDENVLLKDILSKIKEDDHEYQLEFYFDSVPDFVEISKLNAYTDFNKSHTQDKKEDEKEPEVSIYDCFDLFRVPEQLGEENAWYCNKCKEHKRATKKMEIYKAPEIMMIHLKRFRAGSSILSKGKIGTKIEFPTTDLDVGKYVLNHKLPNEYPVNRIKPYYDDTTITPETPSTTENTSGAIVEEPSNNDASNNSGAIIEESKSNNNNSTTATPEWNPTLYKTEFDGLTGSEAYDEKKSLKYDLCGIVNHYGNMGFGHYTAYAFNHIEKKWYCFDDSSVNGESPNSVCTPAGYVLFYKRQSS